MQPCIVRGEIIVCIHRSPFEMTVRRNLQHQIARDYNQVFSTVRTNAGNVVLPLISFRDTGDMPTCLFFCRGLSLEIIEAFMGLATLHVSALRSLICRWGFFLLEMLIAFHLKEFLNSLLKRKVCKLLYRRYRAFFSNWLLLLKKIFRIIDRVSIMHYSISIINLQIIGGLEYIYIKSYDWYFKIVMIQEWPRVKYFVSFLCKVCARRTRNISFGRRTESFGDHK